MGGLVRKEVDRPEALLPADGLGVSERRWLMSTRLFSSVALKQMKTKGLAQLIIDGLSATATDVRTSPLHWIAGFLYVHRLGSCEKAH